jgi:hypothetical protein
MTADAVAADPSRPVAGTMLAPCQVRVTATRAHIVVERVILSYEWDEQAGRLVQ